MIKAIAGKTLFLGVSERNVDLIKQDRPIRVDLKAMGELARGVEVIVIFHGKTRPLRANEAFD